MFRSNTIKGLIMGMFAIALAALLLAAPTVEASANSDAGLEIGCDMIDGTFSGSQADAECSNVPTDVDSWIGEICDGEKYFDIHTSNHPWGYEWDFDSATCHNGATAGAADGTPLNYGMERKGICKLMDVSDAFFGGYITATVKGSPSFLILKLDGKTFKLPVVPGTVVANGNGTFTAQFYTMDPATGQALIPAGEYMVRCSGGSGSNDGSNNTITIGY